MRCPTELDLERFLEGISSDVERTRIEEHRSTCAVCSDWIDEARADEELLPDLLRAGTAARAGGRVADDEPALARYRIVRRIGAGGMGVVYEAEQRSPKRPVALKVLRAGSLSDRSLRRFEHEAQVLGRLDHTGIAQILEAGTYESGGEPQPFFAMELVEGRPLSRWADESDLDLRARLELFLKVCAAVHHAHQKGVVHRDLKPANVLVTADGQPKVLDFGVARTFDVDLKAATVATEAGEIVGTLPYMSPEQLAGDPLEIDTRADVYALGVVLYELLAGRLPHRASGRSVPEAIRRMTEDDPERLGALDRRLVGDLETIVHKALEKDKERRYSSVAALASDVRSYLDHEPIDARHPSAVYHLRKFARRNRAVVAGLTAAFLLLFGGIAATSWQALRARRAELDARDSEQAAIDAEQVARDAEATASAKAEALEELNEFLGALIGFDEEDALGATRNGDMTLAEIVTDAERRLAERPLADAATEARLRVALGNFWRRSGDEARHLANMERAVELRRADMEPSEGSLAEGLNALAVARFENGDDAGGEDALREAVELYELRAEPDDARKLATTYGNLAVMLLQRGEVVGAEELLLKAHDLHVAELGADNIHVADDLNMLARVQFARGRDEEGNALLRDAIETDRRAGREDHQHAISRLATVGRRLRGEQRLTEALPYLRRTVELRVATLGPDHPDVGRDRHALGVLYRELERWTDAEREGRESARVARGSPVERELLAYATLLVGEALLEQGRAAEAEPYLNEALELHLAQRPKDDVVGHARASLGRTLLSLARHAEAERTLRAALSEMQQRGASTGSRFAHALLDHGRALYHLDRHRDALASTRRGLEALEAMAPSLRATHSELRLSGATDLVTMLNELGESTEAVVAGRRELARAESALGPTDPTLLRLRRELGRALVAAGMPAEAEGYLREASTPRTERE